MILTYGDCKKIYQNVYGINKAVSRGELFKLSSGLYSDSTTFSDTMIISKKYPRAVFTMNSAFFYHGLTTTIPSFYYLMTDKNDSKIKDATIKQIFDNYNSLDFGVETLEYCGDIIKIFTKERLLVELIRNKSKLPYDYYKEIIRNYRELADSLQWSKVEEYAECLPKTDLVMGTIQAEVL